ncbi:uncharacterized protein LOC106385252 [Brassica napus]|uniref:Transmembrane protein n=1 Tax=Brassica oleracea TaxID=3712 RepID=A0A3P6AKJ7_BRAOL|nr:uncharacterized protein LOC106385252 [Brassica napus]VDC88083.1 unnamed protein product [Brassica oleracea]
MKGSSQGNDVAFRFGAGLLEQIRFGSDLRRKRKKKMGYVLRVRMASFFAGAATASFIGLYVLYKDYKVANESISHQAKAYHDSLDRRISALESLRQTEAPQLPETTTD